VGFCRADKTKLIVSADENKSGDAVKFKVDLMDEGAAAAALAAAQQRANKVVASSTVNSF
jgi:hypothetical protein